MESIVKKLQSRKLWIIILASVATTLADQLGLSGLQTQELVALAVAYVLGQGYVDARGKED